MWKVRRHRGGFGDKRVGSEKAGLWRPSWCPPCRPLLCHPVAERRLASEGPLEGHWWYVRRALSVYLKVAFSESYDHFGTTSLCLPYQLNLNIKMWAALKVKIETDFTFTWDNNSHCHVHFPKVYNMKITLAILSSATRGHMRPNK